MTTLGGKAGLPPASGLALEAGKAGQSESFAPFANDLTRRVETSGNHIVREALGRHENNPGADNVAIR
jgi:hypothetical protein